MKTSRKIINTPIIVSIILILTIVLLTIGYSVFSAELGITSVAPVIRAYKLVRINGVSSNSQMVSDLNYSHKSIVNTIAIPAGDSVTYSVTVTNLGNVPVAVSSVSFVSGDGTPISNLTSNINSSNYVKICDNNNNCTNSVSKTFDITITNTGNTTISSNLDVILYFTEVYNINYNNGKIDEVLAGSNYSHIFDTNPPVALIVNGSNSGYTYQNNTINITNITSDINLFRAYNVILNEEVIDTVLANSNYTKTFTKDIPKTLAVQGTYDTYSYNNYTLTVNNVGSNLTLIPTYGKIEITNVTYISSTNVERHEPPTFDGMSATFDIKFKKQEGSGTDDFNITYEIELTNDYVKDYIFRGFDFNPIIHSAASSDTAIMHLEATGVTEGEVIPPGTVKTFRVTLWLETNNVNGSFTVEGEGGVDTTEQGQTETGDITATVTQTDDDLTGSNDMIPITISITNSYPTEKEFELLSTNSNLKLVDSSGSPLTSYTISAGTTGTYTVYIKKQANAAFLQATASTNIIISPVGLANINADELTFDVDVFDGTDNDKVIVSSATISMNRTSASSPPTVGQINVSWSRDDEGGTPVRDYGVRLYNASTGSFITEVHTNSGATTCQFTGQGNGTYYVIIYGVDENTSGSEDVGSATIGPGYATRSQDVSFTWTYPVNLTGLSGFSNVSGASIANVEDKYTVTMTTSGSYTVPENFTVSMGGRTLTNNTDYTVTRTNSNRSGTVTINRVTGSIRISGTAVENTGSCLIQGTKVLLANGKYKNVESIGYDDLLMVYNHETGKFVYEYPIWLKNSKTVDEYQETTFSDGSVLKTRDIHGVFSLDLNRFVSVTNKEEFHVGTKIAKINKDRTGFDTITVTKIETKHEQVNYYHIVSSIYFNIIANDIFVSDGHVNLLNRYGFTDNMVWNKDTLAYARQDVYTYEELKDYLPLHLFKGTLAEEAKILALAGYDLSEFTHFIQEITDPDMMKSPMQQFGKNVWMVTTSLDNVTDLNKHEFLRYEGSSYTLPKVNNKNFIGWYNYTDNQIYQPGDVLTVYHGMHFEAIYK